MVTLADKTPVFGRVTRADAAPVVFVESAFYLAGADASDVNLLRPFGLEVHRPEQTLIVPRSSVLYEQPLESTAPVVKAIAAYEASNAPEPSPLPSLATGKEASVFLKSGEVYFGELTLVGDIVRLTDAHFLRFKNGKAGRSDITSLNQVELVPVSGAAGGTTGEMDIPLSSVLYMQLLQSNSPVVEALSKR